LRAGQAGRLALGGLLGLGLLLLFLRGVQWGALVTALTSARKLDLFLVVLATVVMYLFRAWRWGYLLAPLARVQFGHLLSATVVGFMSGLLVPRAGEILRPYLVGRRHAVKTSAAFASIIVERLFDLITVILLFEFYLYVLPMPPQQTRGEFLQKLRLAGTLSGAGAVAITVVLAMFHAHADRAMAVIDRCLSILPAQLARRLSDAARAFSQGLGILQAPLPRLLALAGQSVATWLTIALGIYFNNRAFGLDLPFHTTFPIIGFLTVGVAVPTPGMVGGFHLAYQLALSECFGVDKETAAAAGIASHALTNLPVLLAGLACLRVEGLTLGRVAEIAAEDEDRRP
jgi:glycosyltransferase 2 family protein